MSQIRSSISVAICMFVAMVLTYYLTPKDYLWESHKEDSISLLIPTSFGDWREEKQFAPLVIDPNVAMQLAQIYSETISRSFVNSRGERIMFSLAYGKDQRGEGRTHYPDVCYPAQGFRIGAAKQENVKLLNKNIPVSRLVAINGERTEPITYWILVGEKVVEPGLPHKIAVIFYGLNGKIADGALIRISSIGQNTDASYAIHNEFIDSLSKSLSPMQQTRLFGKI